MNIGVILPRRYPIYCRRRARSVRGRMIAFGLCTAAFELGAEVGLAGPRRKASWILIAVSIGYFTT